MTKSEREQKLRKIITEWAIRFVQLGEADQVKEQLDSKGFIAITIPEIEQFCEELIEITRKEELDKFFDEVNKHISVTYQDHNIIMVRWDLLVRTLNKMDKALKETTDER